MSDKNCENCKLNIATKGVGFINCSRPDNEPCIYASYWQRDPRKWLTIPPTEPGHYWIKHDNNRTGLVEVEKSPDGVLWCCGAPVEKYFCEWQGPITPCN